MSQQDNTAARNDLSLTEASEILADAEVVTVTMPVAEPKRAARKSRKSRTVRARKEAPVAPPAPVAVIVPPPVQVPAPAPVAEEDIDPNTLTIVEQVRACFAPKNRIAAIGGALFGAWVPVAAFWASHHEVDRSATLYTQVAAWAVLFCLAFSLPKVSKWASAAFGGKLAGMSFALLTEVIMVAFETPWITMVGLMILVVINGISGAANIALQRRKPTF